MSCRFYFSFAVCQIFLLFHNIKPCEKELLFFSLFFICLTSCSSHILLFLGNQNQSMRMVLVWMNHSMHFIKVVFLSFVLFICLTVAYPNFYWTCVTKTTTCVRFYFWCIISTNTLDYSYVFMFYTNTSIHNFLSSLLSNFPFSLHHVCFEKTNLVITRTGPGEGKLEYCCKSGKVMVCRRLHKRKISIFHGDCSSRQRGTIPYYKRPSFFFSFLNFFSFHVIL